MRQDGTGDDWKEGRSPLLEFPFSGGRRSVCHAWKVTTGNGVFVCQAPSHLMPQSSDKYVLWHVERRFRQTGLSEVRTKASESAREVFGDSGQEAVQSLLDSLKRIASVDIHFQGDYHHYDPGRTCRSFHILDGYKAQPKTDYLVCYLGRQYAEFLRVTPREGVGWLSEPPELLPEMVRRLYTWIAANLPKGGTLRKDPRMLASEIGLIHQGHQGKTLPTKEIVGTLRKYGHEINKRPDSACTVKLDYVHGDDELVIRIKQRTQVKENGAPPLSPAVAAGVMREDAYPDSNIYAPKYSFAGNEATPLKKWVQEMRRTHPYEAENLQNEAEKQLGDSAMTQNLNVSEYELLLLWTMYQIHEQRHRRGQGEYCDTP